MSKKTSSKIPILAVEKLMKKYTEFRISEDAKEEIQSVLTNHLRELAKKAGEIAKNTGRKTIKKEDILIARE